MDIREETDAVLEELEGARLATELIKAAVVGAIERFILIAGFLAVVVGICLGAGLPAWVVLAIAGFVAMVGSETG